jgi:DNA modification methylase
MPESVTDRPTRAHEYLFLLSKSERYYYDADAIRESAEYGRRSGTNWKRAKDGSPRDSRREEPVTTSGTNRAAGRNKRSVWEIATQPYPEAHFATFPEALVEPCVLAGCPPDGLILDPFVGSGTTCVVAQKLGRRAIGVDLNRDYLELARRRIEAVPLPLI